MSSWVRTNLEENSLPTRFNVVSKKSFICVILKSYFLTLFLTLDFRVCRRYIMIGCFILGSGTSFTFEIGQFKNFTELSKALWEKNKDYFINTGVMNELNLKLWTLLRQYCNLLLKIFLPTSFMAVIML